ncbi:hypothetical protein HMPREF0027_2432, partial [Actinobacillus ureae ATCC 25976]
MTAFVQSRFFYYSDFQSIRYHFRFNELEKSLSFSACFQFFKEQ